MSREKAPSQHNILWVNEGKPLRSCKSIYRKSAESQRITKKDTITNQRHTPHRKTKYKTITNDNKQDVAIAVTDATRLVTTSASVQVDGEQSVNVENAKTPEVQNVMNGRRHKKAEPDVDLQDSAQPMEHNKQKPSFQALQCPFCKFRYRCPKNLSPHVQATHPTQIVVKEGREPTSRYKCLYCEESSARPRNVVSHMHIFHPQHFAPEVLRHTHKFRCAVTGCLQCFRHEAKLQKHMCVVHGQPNRSRQSPRYNIDKLRERAHKVEKGEESIWGHGNTNKEAKHTPSSMSTRKHKSSRLRDCHEDCWHIARQNQGFDCFHCSKTFTYHCQCVMHELRHEVKEDRNLEQCDSQHNPPKQGDTQNTLILDDGGGTGNTKELPSEQQDASSQSSIGREDVDCNSGGIGRLCPKAPSRNSGGCALAHVCPLCKKAFTTVRYAKVHMDVVHKRHTRFVCTDCGKKYLHKKGLTSHQANHHSSGLRPAHTACHECKVCGARLATHSGMKTHMDKHNGVRPYCCRHCDLTFTSMNHWKAHESIHTGHKAHRCPICYKSFTNQGTLYNHLYRYAVHGKLPHVRHYGNGTNIEALTLAAAEQLGRTESVVNKKQQKATQPKVGCKGASCKSLLKSCKNTGSLVATRVAQRNAELPVNTALPTLIEQIDQSQTAGNVTLSDAIQMMTQDMADDTSHQVMVQPGVTGVADTVDLYVSNLQTVDSSEPQSKAMRVTPLSVPSGECGLSGEGDVDLNLLYGQQVAFLIVQPEGVQVAGKLSNQQETVQYIQINMTQGDNAVKYLLPSEIEPIDNVVAYTTGDN